MTFKQLLFAILFVGMSNLLSAQDLIVTNKNDSIKCKITNDDINFIYYLLPAGDSSKIKVKEVSKIRRNYLVTSPSTPIVSNSKEISPKSKGTFRVYVSSGFSYLSSKSISTDNAEIDKHIKALKSGFHYSIGVNYFRKKNLGVGLKYLGFNTSNSVQNIKFIDSGNVITYGNLSDKIGVNFYAASILGKAPLYNNKLELLLGLSVGYVSLKNNSVYINPIAISGNAVGLLYELGFDYKFNEKWAVGMEMNIFQATMRKYTYESSGTTYTKTLEKDKLENISRFEVSGGVRVYFNR